MHGTSTSSDILNGVMKTRAIVSELEHNVTSAHTMVSEIHRTMVKGQEGSDSKDASVSDTSTVFTADQCSPLPRLKPGQKSELPVYTPSYV